MVIKRIYRRIYRERERESPSETEREGGGEKGDIDYWVQNKKQKKTKKDTTDTHIRAKNSISKTPREIVASV